MDCLSAAILAASLSPFGFLAAFSAGFSAADTTTAISAAPSAAFSVAYQAAPNRRRLPFPSRSWFGAMAPEPTIQLTNKLMEHKLFPVLFLVVVEEGLGYFPMRAAGIVNRYLSSCPRPYRYTPTIKSKVVSKKNIHYKLKALLEGSLRKPHESVMQVGCNGHPVNGGCCPSRVACQCNKELST